MIGQCIEWEGKCRRPASEISVSLEVHRIKGALRHYSPFSQEKPLTHTKEPLSSRARAMTPNRRIPSRS